MKIRQTSSKKRNIFINSSVLFLILVCVLTLLSGISHASVYGSKHDLSIYGSSNFKYLTPQVCVFCHTPHGSNDEVREKTSIIKETTGYLNTTSAGGTPLLLWNRALSNSGTDGIGYKTYTSSSLNANTGEVRVYSLLCLSCHDGVGALNVMTNQPNVMIDTDPADGYPDSIDGLTGPIMIGNIDFSNPSFTVDPNIGERERFSGGGGTDDGSVNLTNDHPISFDYTSTLVSADQGGAASPGLETPDAAGWVGDTRVRLFLNPSGNRVSLECSSCHDVHEEGTVAAGTFPFLVMSNSGSALCLNCHLK